MDNGVAIGVKQRKHAKIGSECVFDTGLIYSRVMGLMDSRNLDLRNIFHHELAIVPTPIFTDAGQMTKQRQRQH